MFRRTAFALCIALAAACSSDSKKDGVDPKFDVQVALRSLSGIVRDGDGDGIEGAVVREVGGEETLTGTGGVFALVGLTPGDETVIEIDGSDAGEAGTRFGIARLAVRLGDLGQVALDQPVVLPDLLDGDGASGAVALQNGALSNDFELVDPTAEFALRGSAGTAVTVPGATDPQSVFLAIQPIANNQLPAPLPAGFTVVSAAFVEASGASFAPPLDLSLQSKVGLAGEALQVLHFDPLTGEWLDPVAAGTTEVVATSVTGAIASVEAFAGGWYALASRQDLDCTTAISGRVVDRSSQAAVPGTAVRLSTGDFATTDFDGFFRFDNVAAYDLESLAVDALCQPIDLRLEVETPPMSGSIQDGVTLLAGQIVPGGTVDVGTFELDLDTTGAVAGLLVGELDPQALVSIRSLATGETDEDFDLEPSASGAFFLDGLEAGGFEVSYQFADDSEPTSGIFEIGPSFLTTVVLQRADPDPDPGEGGGGGGVTPGSLTVSVFSVFDIAGSPDGYEAVENAKVRLHNTGATAMTGSGGQVTFSNAGAPPYTVSAQKDIEFEESGFSFVIRQAATVVDHDAPNGTVGLILALDEFPDFPVPDAVISGTVNLGDFGNSQVRILAVSADEFLEFEDFVFGGGYSLNVASGTPYTLIALVQDFFGTVEAVVMRDLAPLSPGQNLTQNFDLAGPGLVAFDQDVSIDFGPLPPVTQADGTVYLNLYDSDGSLKASFRTFSGIPDGATIQLPSLASLPNSGPVSVEFEYSGLLNGQDVDGNCEYLADSLAGPFVADFAAPATFLSPAAGSTLTPAQAANMRIEVSSGQTSDNGLNLASVGGFVNSGQISGVSAFLWTLFLPGDLREVNLGQIELPDPVFTADQEISVNFQEVVVEGIPFTLEDLLDDDLPDKLTSALIGADSICSSNRSIQIVTD